MHRADIISTAMITVFMPTRHRPLWPTVANEIFPCNDNVALFERNNKKRNIVQLVDFSHEPSIFIALCLSRSIYFNLNNMERKSQDIHQADVVPPTADFVFGRILKSS